MVLWCHAFYSYPHCMYTSTYVHLIPLSYYHHTAFFRSLFLCSVVSSAKSRGCIPTLIHPVRKFHHTCVHNVDMRLPNSHCFGQHPTRHCWHPQCRGDLSFPRPQSNMYTWGMAQSHPGERRSWWTIAWDWVSTVERIWVLNIHEYWRHENTPVHCVSSTCDKKHHRQSNQTQQKSCRAALIDMKCMLVCCHSRIA